MFTDILLRSGRVISMAAVIVAASGILGATGQPLYAAVGDAKMRRDLRTVLQEFDAAAAAAAGRAWYLIAPRKVMTMQETRNGSPESTSPWVAIVLADIEGKCRPVAFYQSIDRDKLDPDLSRKLDE